jgi:hypothetical protein
VLRKEGNGQRERSTLEFCFTRNYGNKMRMRARGELTWVGPRGWAHEGGQVGEEYVGVAHT